MSEPVQVAVGVVQRGDGLVLVARRDASRHQGGGLEFPGGKVESGERVEGALERELVEELGIRPLASSPFMVLTHRYSDRAVALHVHRVTDWSGDPLAASPEDCAWRDPSALDYRDFPAANRPILAALQWPARSAVTPSLEWDEAGGLSPGWRLALEAGLRDERACLLRLRLAPRSRRPRPSLDWLRAHEPSHPATRLLVNGLAERVESLPPWVGRHLTAREAGEAASRPVSQQRLLSCACHDAAEIEQAAYLDADLAYVGPVKPTPSHPEARPLGWDGFQALAERTHLPLYAIGGLGAADVPDARAAGAVGVAGIRGFWPA